MKCVFLRFWVALVITQLYAYAREVCLHDPSLDHVCDFDYYLYGGVYNSGCIYFLCECIA